MNLKEAFRYVKFLDSIFARAVDSFTNREHSLVVTEKHLKSKAYAEAKDEEKTVERDPFVPNDDAIKFARWVIEEKGKLIQAINAAKHSLDFDLDAAIQCNMLRQRLNSRLKYMLDNFKNSTKKGSASDYKFNVDGNQTPYYYETEIIKKEDYDREKSKGIMDEVIVSADKISADIDAAMINTIVDYKPSFNPNDSFEDAVEKYKEITKG